MGRFLLVVVVSAGGHTWNPLRVAAHNAKNGINEPLVVRAVSRFGGFDKFISICIYVWCEMCVER